MKFLKEKLSNWNLFEKIWLVAFTAIGIILSVIWKESIIGFLAFLTGIICVVLVAKGSIWNYAFGLVNVMAYAWVAYQSRLFGEVMLNMLYFLPFQFIGCFMWKKHMNKKKEVAMKKLTLIQNLFIIGIVILLVFGYQQLLILLGGNLTLLDSASTVVSVVAMVFMAFRYREQWSLWIVVNIVSVTMWMISGVYIMALMWFAYLINAIYGLYKWSKNGKLNV